MAYNKVIKKDGTVLLDLTNNMVVAETLGKNITAIDKHGNKITGTLTDSPIPIEVSTEEEMNALLETGESGSIYKYVGESGTYENGTLYILEGTQESDPLQGTWLFNDNYEIPSRNAFLYIWSDTALAVSIGKVFCENQNSEIVTKEITCDYLSSTEPSIGKYIGLEFKFLGNTPVFRVATNGVVGGIPVTSNRLKTFEFYDTINSVEYSNEFLTWLQANATKQPSRTFEKLLIPTGTLDITANGEYDVSTYAKANVNIINALQYKIDNNGDNPSCRFLFYEWQGTDPTLSFTGVDTSNVTDMYAMFGECTNLTTIPLLDTSNVTDMTAMFSYCTNLTTIPQLDTSKVTNMYYMFDTCTNLTTIPPLDTSNVTNMNSMFNNCTNLTTIPQLDTSNVTDMNYMFANCTNLTTIPPLDVSSVTDIEFMFDGSDSLTNVTLINMENTTADYGGMFSGCTNLKSLIMRGATKTFYIRDSTQFETQDLVNLIDSLGTSTATGMRRPRLIMGEDNLAKLTDEQKAVAYAKGWQLM